MYIFIYRDKERYLIILFIYLCIHFNRPHRSTIDIEGLTIYFHEYSTITTQIHGNPLKSIEIMRLCCCTETSFSVWKENKLLSPNYF